MDSFLGNNCQAYYDNGNPIRIDKSWEANAKNIIRTMGALHRRDPSSPFYTHFGLPITEAYAFFGGLPDLVFLNPYTILYRAKGPCESGKLIRQARMWIDPWPILTLPEAFSDSVKAGRDLTPEEVSFAMWNEIAEGARGVRYFTKHVRRPGRGYSQMPGVEAQIARDSLNLQLLKNFLRIGDTCNLASTDNNKIVCKAILCGDKGIVLIGLSRNFSGKVDTPSRWTRVRDVEVNVTIPAGQRISQVFEVDQGLRRIKFAQTDRGVILLIPSIRTVRVYLLRFEQPGEVSENSPASQPARDLAKTRPKRQTPMSVERISKLHEDHIARLSQIALPLLEPGLHLDDNRVVRIGLRLYAARGSVLW